MKKLLAEDLKKQREKQIELYKAGIKEYSKGNIEK